MMPIFRVEEDNINVCERFLLRKGDINTPIGVFRAAMANKGILEKEHFINLVKINYFLEKDKELPMEISSKITNVWHKAEKFFEDLNIIEEFGEDKIIIKEPKECFLI